LNITQVTQASHGEAQPTITPAIIIVHQGSFSLDATFGADRGQATAGVMR